MKIHRAAVAQFRCNLCCDWHTSRQPMQPASSINLCQQCFLKAKNGSSLKVLDPVDLEVYELCVKRTGVPSDESRSTNVQAINQLAEFYQRKGREEKLKSLSEVLGEFQRLESEVFQSSEPFRDFVNNLYRQQLSRIEEIWKGTLAEIDRASALIQCQRKRIKSKLESYQYDVQHDEAGLFDPQLHNNKLQEVRIELQTLQNLKLDGLKDAFRVNPDQFFASNFSLKQVVLPSQKLITENELDDSQLLQFTQKSQLGVDEHSCLPQESMLLLESSRMVNMQNGQRTQRQQSSQKKSQNSHKKADCTVDKENLLNCTPLVFRQRDHADSKPSKSTYLSTRKETTTHREIVKQPSTMVKPRKSIGGTRKQQVYPPVDLTEMREWPREKILELLNRRDNIPKGYNTKPPSVLRVYPERVMTSTICQALDNTLSSNNAIELIGYPTQDLQFLGYLEMLKWTPRVELVKFVKVGLTDQNFNLLLCFIARAEKVASLVVSNNYLTEQSVLTLVNFCKVHRHLRQVYFGRNYVNQQRSKPLLAELKQQGTTVYL